MTGQYSVENYDEAKQWMDDNDYHIYVRSDGSDKESSIVPVLYMELFHGGEVTQKLYPKEVKSYMWEWVWYRNKTKPVQHRVPVDIPLEQLEWDMKHFCVDLWEKYK